MLNPCQFLSLFKLYVVFWLLFTYFSSKSLFMSQRQFVVIHFELSTFGSTLSQLGVLFKHKCCPTVCCFINISVALLTFSFKNIYYQRFYGRINFNIVIIFCILLLWSLFPSVLHELCQFCWNIVAIIENIKSLSGSWPSK